MDEFLNDLNFDEDDLDDLQMPGNSSVSAEEEVDVEDASEKDEERHEHDDDENDDDEDDERHENDDDEDDEVSGCDPTEPYYPFAVLPEFQSKRYQRIEALSEWLDMNEVGTLQLADQSQDENDPLQLPVVARFSFKCVRQTESELGNDVLIILLGHDENNPHGGFYSVFYEGARTLDHIANVGSDDKVHPYGTLSSVGKLLYGTNCNGWKAFEVHDTNSAHHGKPLGVIRTSEGGPGFRNTLDPELLQQWAKTGQKKLNKEANHYLERFREAVVEAKRRALKQTEPLDDEEEDNSDVSDKETEKGMTPHQKLPNHLLTRHGTRVFPPQLVKKKKRVRDVQQQDSDDTTRKRAARIDDDGVVME